MFVDTHMFSFITKTAKAIKIQFSWITCYEKLCTQSIDSTNQIRLDLIVMGIFL